MLIDWSKAPEGATHWDSRGNGCSLGFMKPGQRVGDWEYFGIDGHWVLYGQVDEVLYEAMFKIPDPINWTGEGLPPVGTVCEIRAHKLNDWSPATIKFAARNVIVWDWEAEPALNGLCTAYAHAIEIRPIRTPEQIAAEKYEEDAAALATILSSLDGSDKTFIAKTLLDCGYSKQVTE